MLSFCYNKGCGKKFPLIENGPEKCKYHPGVPVFHDAYKGWGCCNKKVTDFTEFLNIPGCTIGTHNPEKPPEPEKKDIVTTGSAADENGSVEVKAKPPPTSASRDPAGEPLKSLKMIINAQLRSMLAKKLDEEEEQKKKLEAENGTDEKREDPGPIEIPPGTSCKNNACGRTYDPAGTTPVNCWHHPGVAIFHEGMKFWSCCNRKTSDFDNFLSQVGCTRGDHKWIADEKDDQGELECREDFHQTGSLVVVTLYSKKSHPEATKVEANPVKISIHLENLDGQVLDRSIDLWGAIDVESSSVNLTPNKVEIKLKKADPVSWSKLEYEYPEPDSC